MAQNQDIFAPSVQPSEQAPRDELNVQTNPAQFGALVAQGAQGLGEGVQKDANFWEQVQTDHTTNGVLQQLSDLNEQTKNLKGQDALDAQQAVLKQASDTIDTGRKSLETPAQQLAYDSAIRNMWFRLFQPQLNNHFNQQGQEVAAATFKSTVDQAIGFVPSVAGDQAKVDAFAEDAAHAGANMAYSRYGTAAPDEIVNQHAQQAKAAVYKTQIETLEQTDAPAAMAALERNKATLGADYPQLLQRLRPVIQQGAVQGYNDGLMNGGHAQPGATPYAMPVGIPPEGQALLDTIKGPESGGRYNVAYDGSPTGRTFDDLSKFPTLPGAPGPAGTSHAAGAYQFEPATWNGVAAKTGTTDFSPQSQDTNAWQLAQDTYQSKTGRALTDDLKEGNTSDIPGALKDQWPSLGNASLATLNSKLGTQFAGAVPSGNAEMAPIDKMAPDWNALKTKAASDWSGNPTMQRKVLSDLEQREGIWRASTGDMREQLSATIPDTIRAAENGVQGLTLDENAVRTVFPKSHADQIMAEFQIASRVGDVMRGLQWASPDDVAQAQQDIESGEGVKSLLLHAHAKEAASGPGVAGAVPDAGTAAFYNLRAGAARQLEQVVTQRNQVLFGPSADPVAYVSSAPTVAAAAKAVDPAKPETFETYANSVTAMQNQLGVPPAQQHVLTRGQALSQTQALMSNMDDPQAAFLGLKQSYGGGWDKAFQDLVMMGNLPPAYQAVATLEDPTEAKYLAKALNETRPKGDGAPTKTWDDILTTKGVSDIKTAVSSDPGIQSLMLSLARSGSSVSQVREVQSAVETLAFAHRFYDNDPTAAQKAVSAFMNQYEFLDNGGARVPAKSAEVIKQNAGLALNGLAPDGVTVPKGFGGNLQPTAQEYIDQVKAAPTWKTSRRGDAIELWDWQNRRVVRPDGSPFAVRFDAGAPPSPALPDISQAPIVIQP